MKKRLATFGIISCFAFIMIGADMKPVAGKTDLVRQHCVGYTVIEAGMGVDCYGDTVTLIRRNGFFELSDRNEKHPV